MIEFVSDPLHFAGLGLVTVVSTTVGSVIFVISAVNKTKSQDWSLFPRSAMFRHPCHCTSETGPPVKSKVGRSPL